MGPNTNSLSRQSLSHAAGYDTFVPPFKKSDSAFSTPYQQEPRRAFKTPMKSSGGPNQLRKRLAFADKSSPQPVKKLRLGVDVSIKSSGNQNYQPMGNVTLDAGVRKTEANKSENAGKNNGSELQRNIPEENAPENSVVKEILRQRQAAHRSQLRRIAEKQRVQSVRPTPGALFTLKTTSQRVSLKDAVSWATPGGHTMQQVCAVEYFFCRFCQPLFCVSSQRFSLLTASVSEVILSSQSFIIQTAPFLQRTQGCGFEDIQQVIS